MHQTLYCTKHFNPGLGCYVYYSLVHLSFCLFLYFFYFCQTYLVVYYYNGSTVILYPVFITEFTKSSTLFLHSRFNRVLYKVFHLMIRSFQFDILQSSSMLRCAMRSVYYIELLSRSYRFDTF